MDLGRANVRFCLFPAITNQSHPVSFDGFHEAERQYFRTDPIFYLPQDIRLKTELVQPFIRQDGLQRLNPVVGANAFQGREQLGARFGLGFAIRSGALVDDNLGLVLEHVGVALADAFQGVAGNPSMAMT
ncbi:hypothetical protein [Marinobacter pelagius]|uniref:hypothetical protein n=1 Tax=Marinobacter pelagius TaxID=379482 RepID=UPI0015875A67|nr:hypothetical protein [Marinobacter pelagius]